jgi:hypothetical protein
MTDRAEDQAPEAEGPRSAADLARDAALQSLVSNAVYLLVMLGFTLALANRDKLGRLALRLGRRWSAARAAEERTVAEFRRELSDYEHGGTP